MQDSLIVGILQGLADLRDDRKCFMGFEIACLNRVTQVHAVDVFHQKVKVTIGFSGTIDLHDVALFSTVYTPAPAAAATSAVPEPSGLLLALFAAGALMQVTRRRTGR